MKTTLKLMIVTLLCSIFMIKIAYADGQLPPDTPQKTHTTVTDDSTVTTHKKEKNEQTIKTIQNGAQKEIRVTNKIGTYIVKLNQGVGTSLPGDAQSSSNHAAQWVVKSWGGSKEPEPNEAPPTSPTNPNNANSPR